MPGLHIAGVVSGQAAADGHERIGVLGISYTMDGPLYPRAFAAPGHRSGSLRRRRGGVPHAGLARRA
ncbi:MAG TPA: hypothetical protein VGI74_00545 [Streptosporangiaceae bacterium]